MGTHGEDVDGLLDRAEAVFDHLDAKERALAEIQRRSDAMVESMRSSTFGG